MKKQGESFIMTFWGL